jgi:hypothetical protein
MILMMTKVVGIINDSNSPFHQRRQLEEWGLLLFCLSGLERIDRPINNNHTTIKTDVKSGPERGRHTFVIL